MLLQGGGFAGSVADLPQYRQGLVEVVEGPLPIPNLSYTPPMLLRVAASFPRWPACWYMVRARLVGSSAGRADR